MKLKFPRIYFWLPPHKQSRSWYTINVDTYEKAKPIFRNHVAYYLISEIDNEIRKIEKEDKNENINTSLQLLHKLKQRFSTFPRDIPMQERVASVLGEFSEEELSALNEFHHIADRMNSIATCLEKFIFKWEQEQFISSQELVDLLGIGSRIAYFSRENETKDTEPPTMLFIRAYLDHGNNEPQFDALKAYKERVEIISEKDARLTVFEGRRNF